jgi:hypothetical protein
LDGRGERAGVLARTLSAQRFNGVVAAAEIQGTAHGSDNTAYSFDADMRFMQGTYVDVDGQVRDGAFGFV